ncbi:MAG: cyclic nucleotide-binding domain-containing protein [Alphaproteobacteria bacterium]
MFFKKDQRFEQELEKVFQDGEVIVREGDLTREMYIIQSGQAVATKRAGDHEIILNTMEKGDFFGEMSLLESEPRSATVRAKGEVRVYVIHSGGFLLKIRRDPTFAFEMLQKMSGRIRSLSGRYADEVERQASMGTEQMHKSITGPEYQHQPEDENEPGSGDDAS